jgi:hypothetical protein
LVLRGIARRSVPTAALLAGAAVLLAILTTIAAYGTVSQNGTTRSSHVDRPPGESAQFIGTFRPEKGPEGLSWQWMKDTGQLVVRGRGQYWLALRAQSLGRPRTLSVTSSTQKIELRVKAKPATELVGPLMIFGNQRFALTARPRAQRATKVDKRRLAMFLSSPTLVRTPAAALPGSGFFERERDASGAPFMWLSQDGRVDLIAIATVRQVWFSFLAMSPLRRILTVDNLSSSRRVGRVAVPGDRRNHTVTVGPIGLVGRRAALVIRAEPGPKRIGSDPRALSVRVMGLTVATRSPVAGPVPPR